jgi:uncharacterized protein YbjT (DUF2867 family)
MKVLVVGGHGKIALRLLRLLADRGDVARGLIRNPDHAGQLERAGAEPVLCDLEATDDISAPVEESDAVVFAAGAGPGSGPERKRTVDLGGATKLIAACAATGVRRYLIVSAMGVGSGSYPPRMRSYYDAKREADDAVRDSGLDYTIARPGRLTDEPGTGLVAVGAPLAQRGEVTRDDVAATLLACLDEPRTARLTFDLLNGETPIEAALASLIAEAGGGVGT